MCHELLFITNIVFRQFFLEMRIFGCLFSLLLKIATFQTKKRKNLKTKLPYLDIVKKNPWIVSHYIFIAHWF
jgi:hypothetical protein